MRGNQSNENGMRVGPFNGAGVQTSVMEDWNLLQQYISEETELAFAELVRRHTAMVYSTALRHVRDPHLAQEVTQSAFVTLARKARRLNSKVVLSGWLYNVTRLIVRRVYETQTRRRRYEDPLLDVDELKINSEAMSELGLLVDEALAASHGFEP